MGEMYLGSIFLWSLPWVPDDLMFCNGQLLQINNNQPLFALIGTTYGGDGQTTFALPDLRSRVPIGTNMNAGASPNLTPVTLAQKGGSENAVVVAHNHTAAVANTAVSLQGGFSVNNQAATLDAPTVGCSLAAMLTSNGGEPPETGPALGYNNLQPNTAILGLNANGVLANNGTVNVAQAGGSGTYANMQPFLGMNYVMVINGIFPMRP